jgi:hypothetical protein
LSGVDAGGSLDAGQGSPRPAAANSAAADPASRRIRKEEARMRSALVQLAEDFLSTIVFLVLFVASGNLVLAVACALAVGIGQFALLRWRGKPIDLMQGLSLALVIGFGTAALITEDSRFMMAKPSVIHFAVGAVMLRPGWMSRYMPPLVRKNVPAKVLMASGYVIGRRRRRTKARNTANCTRKATTLAPTAPTEMNHAQAATLNVAATYRLVRPSANISAAHA